VIELVGWEVGRLAEQHLQKYYTGISKWAFYSTAWSGRSADTALKPHLTQQHGQDKPGNGRN